MCLLSAGFGQDNPELNQRASASGQHRTTWSTTTRLQIHWPTCCRGAVRALVATEAAHHVLGLHAKRQPNSSCSLGQSETVLHVAVAVDWGKTIFF